MVRRLRGMSIQAMDPCLSSSIHAAGEQASFLSSPKPDTAKRLTATRKGPCSCQPRGSRPKETSALWYVVGGGGGAEQRSLEVFPRGVCFTSCRERRRTNKKNVYPGETSICGEQIGRVRTGDGYYLNFFKRCAQKHPRVGEGPR